MLILHTVGAKSKLAGVTPLMCWPESGRYLIITSDRGRDSNPAWFHNLAAQPEAQIEVGTEAARYPGFAQHQARTERVIPFVALDLRPSPTTR